VESPKTLRTTSQAIMVHGAHYDTYSHTLLPVARLVMQDYPARSSILQSTCFLEVVSDSIRLYACPRISCTACSRSNIRRLATQQHRAASKAAQEGQYRPLGRPIKAYTAHQVHHLSYLPMNALYLEGFDWRSPFGEHTTLRMALCSSAAPLPMHDGVGCVISGYQQGVPAYGAPSPQAGYVPQPAGILASPSHQPFSLANCKCAVSLPHSLFCQ
jgi:hypothetical protein